MDDRIVPIHSLYFARAAILRWRKRVARKQRRFDDAAEAEVMAWDAERQAIEIRKRMGNCPWMEWPPAPEAA